MTIRTNGKHHNRRSLGAQIASLAVAVSLACGTALAVDVPQLPLQSGLGVPPNIMLVVDNSGSMDSEILFPNNDGALWWNTSVSDVGAQSFYGAGRNGTVGFNYNAAGGANATWQKYNYLFPNGGGLGNRIYTDDNDDHFAVPPLPEFAFARSSDYNAQYYNPAINYEPWPSRGTTVFADANATAVKSDPVSGTGTFNLTADLFSTTANWLFRVQSGMRSSAATNVRAVVESSVAFSYFPATYYQKNTTASVTLGGVTYQCGTPDPLAYQAYATNPTLAVLPAGVDAIAPDGGCLTRYEVKSGVTFPSGRNFADEQQNFANWFQYHRKRHLALRAGMGSAFADLGGVRAGGFPINNRTAVTMWNIDTQRANLFDWVYGIGGNGGGTPNREAAKFALDQFNTNTGVIQLACQQNFTLQFTDGFGSPSTIAGIANEDGGKGVPYADAFSSTLADIAMKAYTGPLRAADFALQKVPVPALCLTANPPAWIDCNRDLHANHYGITLGAQGEIFGVTHNDVRDAYTATPAWQNPVAVRSPVQVDDLYHAAVNGRGEMLNARSTDELASVLKTALQGIQSQVQGSQSSVAVNSTRLDSGSTVYQARYSSVNWSGELLALEVKADGTIGDLRWNAALVAPLGGASANAGSRRIYTRNGSVGVEFQWANLTAGQQTALGSAAVLDYLRGVRTGETQFGGTLRNRSSALGDFVHSSPYFVKDNNTIFLGSNGGMLHAFDAATGAEQFAFVPDGVDFAALRSYSQVGYSHRFSVDGDVAVSTRLQTPGKNILVGALGRGGNGLYALDVTNPGAFSATDVKWRFTDADMGQVLGKPVIARMNDGTMAVIVGNGVNSTSERSLMYVINLETGALIKKFDTGQGSALASNGMFTPRGWDTDVNGTVDYIYGGDLLGNVWKLDVTDKSISKWDFSFTAAGKPAPLFVARDGSGNRQPITGALSVGLDPATYNRWIFVGTGRYLSTTDISSKSVQSWYGFLDENAVVVGRSVLTQRSIVVSTIASGRVVRGFSQAVDGDMVGKKGWYMDLVPPSPALPEGERMVGDSFLIGRILIGSSIVPSDQVCEVGGRGYINAIDAFTGAALTTPFFDINGNGSFGDDDKVALPSGGTVPVGSIDLGIAMPTTPAVIERILLAGGSTGQTGVIGINNPVVSGRISWREIVRD